MFLTGKLLSQVKGGKKMSEIRVKEGESLESALRRFKRSTARSGVLAEVRKREAYEKPSVMPQVLVYRRGLIIGKVKLLLFQDRNCPTISTQMIPAFLEHSNAFARTLSNKGFLVWTIRWSSCLRRSFVGLLANFALYSGKKAFQNTRMTIF